MKQFLIVFFALLGVSTAAVLDANFGGRIIGGTNATTGLKPWHVAVESFILSTSTISGGALIASNWVLTSARGVSGYTSHFIRAGSIQLHNPLIQVPVTTAFVHPNFNSSNQNNNLALLLLAYNIASTPNIAPIRLPAVSPSHYEFLSFETVLSGFGRLNNETTALSPNLQVLNMNIISNTKCQGTYGTSMVNDGVMCAIGAESILFGACMGDHGSPLVITEDNVPTLVGIVSFADQSCGSGDPTVLVRVSRYLTWINEVTGIPLRE